MLSKVSLAKSPKVRLEDHADVLFCPVQVKQNCFTNEAQGISLYGLLSLVNSSCIPNCTVIEDPVDGRKVIFARRDILPEEEASMLDSVLLCCWNLEADGLFHRRFLPSISSPSPTRTSRLRPGSDSSTVRSSMATRAPAPSVSAPSRLKRLSRRSMRRTAREGLEKKLKTPTPRTSKAHNPFSSMRETPCGALSQVAWGEERCQVRLLALVRHR